jgi:hypothetical protein
MCVLCCVAAVMVDTAGPSWKVKPVALQGRRGQEAESEVSCQHA